MSTTTTRNALVKPAYTDAADIGVINTNMDTIDASFAKCNWAATTAPGSGDDSGDGYSIGSIWFDTTNNAVYIAKVVTAGAAVWDQVYPQGSSAHAVAADPTANDDSGDGYVIGSMWVNTSTDAVFIAADVTVGAAVWRSVYPAVISGYLKADGSVALTSDWNAGSKNITTTGALSGSTLVATLAAGGAAPMTITSTTKVTNLNADQLDGLDDTAFVKQTLADAKGDIIVASGNDTWTRLAVGSNTYVLTANSSATNGVEWAAAAGGAQFWTLMPGSPTRVDNTSFTITDTSNANLYDLQFSKGTLIKWTEAASVKIAMVAKSAYAANVVTIDIVGNTMASIDASSLKYCLHKAEFTEFIVPGSIPNVATSDVARTFYAPFSLYPLQAEGWHKTAGTTNDTVYDINDDGTSIFGGAAVTIATTATTNIDADDRGNPAAAPGTEVVKSSLVTVDIVSASTTNPIDAYIRFWYMPKYYLYRS